MAESKTAVRRVWWIVAIALALVAAIVLGVMAYLAFVPGSFDADRYKTSSVAVSSDADVPLPANPIDFPTLRAENIDICGWITVPNTNVDYPILQSSRDDNTFYLNHDAQGNYSSAGSIYIHRTNSYNFTDPNTVIYGHNMLNGSMFRTLHNFRDPEFLEANDTFYIYTPGHILTYKIFAAYRYDNRLILAAFDFSDKEVFASYIESCLNPTSMIRNVREGVSVTADDRIVTLSTCISDDRYRYLVQGVLIQDDITA